MSATAFALALIVLLGGLLFARKQWLVWLLQAMLAAVVVLLVGLLTLGLPGAVFLETATNLGLVHIPLDAGWPLALEITFDGAALVLPVSLALRYLWPDIVGWRHGLAAGLVTGVGTFFVTLLVASKGVGPFSLLWSLWR